MRLVLGIILGFFLTVGITYVADSGRHQECTASEAGPVVNWDVVNLRLRELSSTLQDGWHRLTNH